MADDIVVRIRKRFPRPIISSDGLLADEAADEIMKLRLRLANATEKQRVTIATLEALSASLRINHVC